MTTGVKLGELPKLAEKIVGTLQPGDVLALSGPLAAGKTTLTQQLLIAMGYAGRVTSPSFVLEKHYPVNFNGITDVTHLDFYRLQPKDLESFGWQDYLAQPGTLTIVEWPEIGLEYLPKDTKQITIKIIDDHTRQFQFSDHFGF